jgi:hypothetical protein
VKPHPDWRHVRIYTRIGLNASIASAWRRPGGQPYIFSAGPIHEANPRTTRTLRRITEEAADAALYRDDDER